MFEAFFVGIFRFRNAHRGLPIPPNSSKICTGLSSVAVICPFSFLCTAFRHNQSALISAVIYITTPLPATSDAALLLFALKSI